MNNGIIYEPTGNISSDIKEGIEERWKKYNEMLESLAELDKMPKNIYDENAKVNGMKVYDPFF